MSALAMIQTAALAIPGDGPKEPSMEMRKEKLDVSGEWKGRWKTDKAEYEVELFGEK